MHGSKKSDLPKAPSRDKDLLDALKKLSDSNSETVKRHARGLYLALLELKR